MGDKGQADEEQERQDCLQEGLRAREAGLRQQRSEEVGRRSQGGAQGARADGLRGRWRQVRRGQGALRQGQDVAGLSSASRAREASPEGEGGRPLPWQDYAVWLMLPSESSRVGRYHCTRR